MSYQSRLEGRRWEFDECKTKDNRQLCDNYKCSNMTLLWTASIDHMMVILTAAPLQIMLYLDAGHQDRFTGADSTKVMQSRVWIDRISDHRCGVRKFYVFRLDHWEMEERVECQAVIKHVKCRQKLKTKRIAEQVNIWDLKERT